MIRRILALVVLVWALGFVWFAAALPQPAGAEKTDAIVVPTGSGGRIARGLEILDTGAAQKMLVSGVDPQVKPVEFQAEYEVSDAQMDCCITLGFAAVDTRGNALETAQWMAGNSYTSLRLVTADWHMRRAAHELGQQMPDDIVIVRDAVRSEVSLRTLFGEYHKLLISYGVRLVG